MEKLSVIIPAHNAEKYLASAVGSVKKQLWPGGLEIIIIDDGSSDSTAALAEKLGDRVIKKPRGGAASARNAGLAAATGELILLLDADDELTPGALAALFAPLAADGETLAAFALAEDFISPELTPEQAAALRPRKGSYGGVLPGCSLIRRQVFQAAGLFDESLKSGETVAWQLRLRDMKLKTVSVDFVTLRRRLHLTNTGRLEPKREMSDYAALLRRRLREK